jgi:hypothetical protein
MFNVAPETVNVTVWRLLFVPTVWELKVRVSGSNFTVAWEYANLGESTLESKTKDQRTRGFIEIPPFCDIAIFAQGVFVLASRLGADFGRWRDRGHSANFGLIPFSRFERLPAILRSSKGVEFSPP